jgi:ABC-2 type transport system permease protein
VSTAEDVLVSRPPRAAFGKLLACDARLTWREPIGLVLGLAIPVVLLVVFGTISMAQHKAEPQLGGLTVIAVYIPILIAFSLGMLALFSLPRALVTYRELGILRRLSTTPLPPSWVLAAQVVINFVLAVWALIILVVGGAAAFGVAAPKNPAGFALAFLLAVAALFAMGLWIAAVARSATAANAMAGVLFFPLVFFAGLWYPQQFMPAALRDVGQLTPLGASVQALQTATQGHFPPAGPLLVMAAYAVVFAVLAWRSFRWE